MFEHKIMKFCVREHVIVPGTVIRYSLTSRKAGIVEVSDERFEFGLTGALCGLCLPLFVSRFGMSLYGWTNRASVFG